MTKHEILKVTEVRKEIKKHKRDELEYIIAEIYKMIPRDKKIENSVSDLILNPGKSKAAPKSKNAGKKLRPFNEVENEVENFVSNAYEQYYLIPNRIVKKSDRSKWRFLVKRLYKELVSYSTNDEYRGVSARLLQKLYEVLCYSCGYTLFTAYDSFESIGIDQTTFFHTILTINEKRLSKNDFIDTGINLIINNYLNRYTLYSELIDFFIELLTIPDLYYKTIEEAEKMWKKINKTPVKYDSWGSDYDKVSKLNNITEIVFKCYAKLFEFENGIRYFKKYQIEDNQEVKLYILIRLLFREKQKKIILEELKNAQKNGIKPRKSLLEMKQYIEEKNSLPDYF